MPDNGSIQKRDAHEMAHGRPVQITEHTTGNRAAAQPVRCRVRKQKAADWLYRCARGTGAAVGLCSSSAFRRYQNLGLHHRGHRSKER